MEPIIGEIRMFAGRYVPEDWAMCDGTLLSINQYQALYSLIGTQYGGDGRTTFALPDLRDRVPVGMGQGDGLSVYTLGQQGGAAQVALTGSQTPTHTHALSATTVSASSASPEKTMFATVASPNVFYVDGSKEVTGESNYSPNAVSVQGACKPHDNVMHGLGVTFIICISQGVYPDLN